MTDRRTLVRNQEKTIHTVIKAIFFDVDGTLTDSRPSIYASYRHAALNAGLPMPSDDMLAHHLCGGLPDNVRELFGVEGDAASEVIGLYRRY